MSSFNSSSVDAPRCEIDVLDWDAYFLNLCESVALRSKDESTKLGALIVGPDREIRATGFNSFPRGIRDDIAARQERPEKYKWFEHAERNAIYNAARCGTATKGCSLYCRWLPCSDCARGIIQAGITEIIVQTFDIPERWQGDMSISIKMLWECRLPIRLANKQPRPWDEILESWTVS